MWRRLWPLLAVALFSCSSPDRPARLPAPDGANLTIATFNVHFARAGDASTLEAVGRTGADVIFLQELSPGWQTALSERYTETYPFMLFAPARGAGGLGVLSRWPLEDAGFLPAVIHHPAWLVKVGFPPASLHVLNVHLRASRRRGQNLLSGLIGMSADHEEEIATFMRRANAPPSIVLGDFNEGFRGTAIGWLEQRGFVNALAVHDPDMPTWRAGWGVFRSTLDHVLTRGCVSSIDAWVLHAGASDHWPVVARLNVAPPARCR